MRKRLTLALSVFALFQALPAIAQQAAPAPTAAPAVAAVIQTNASPALWVVKDSDTTIYLFGTIHMLPEGINWNQGAVKAAFESADSLKLEIANLEADTPIIQKLMLEKGRLPEGQKLSDGLTDAQKSELTRIISQSGFPPEAMETMRPWTASILLAVSLYMKMGFDPTKGVDKTLDTLARARGIPVEGFETSAQQVGFFADMPADQQRALLLSTLEDWDQSQAMLNDMVRSWTRGNSNRIGKLMTFGMRSQPELARVLLTDRNRNWADWIASRMEQPGTVFVAVGAGHLAGRDSVQSFLRTKGLSAQPVRNPAQR